MADQPKPFFAEIVSCLRTNAVPFSRTVFRLLCLFVFLSVIGTFAEAQAGGGVWAGLVSALIYLSTDLIVAAILAWISAMWYRDRYGILGNWREIGRFFPKYIGLSILLMLPALFSVITLVAALGASGWIDLVPQTLVVVLAVIMAVSYWTVFRFGLVFPALALDEKITFRQSWQNTKQYRWQVLPLVIALTGLAVASAYVYHLFPPQYHSLATVWYCVIIWCAKLVEMAAIYVMFKETWIGGEDISDVFE